jgi:ABC-type phosphate/phosphonate transport system permease subunit
MKKLIERQNISENLKASNSYQQLGKLLNALEVKALPTETIDLINQEIEQLNSITDIDKYFVKATKEKENRVIKLVEKKHKIVPKNYYKKLWMILGMSAFGVPIGIAFGLSIGNLAMLGIGLPIGMAIGVGVGSNMDKKAFNEGRQLDFEVKY